MRIDFRHGLYRAEIDSITRQPIVAIIDGSSLVTRVTNSPVVWTLAQFDKNYTLAEYKTRVIATLSDLNQAAETWVYVQINLTTGVHSFGVTPYLPTYGPEAPVGVDGQLWFNTVDKVTKRYESVSRTWRRTMCLVIGRWDGQTFHSIDFGSAVGLNATDCETGTIVRNAVNRGISDGLHGFLTTADHLFTDSDNTHDFKLESNITRATAVEPIPAFHVVTYTEFGQVRLANYEDTSDAVIALSTSSAATGDPVELLLQGKAYNQGLWNWPEVNAALWVGESGKLVDEDPRDPQDSRPSKVPIARVIGKDTILFEQGMGGKGERGERGIQIPATDQYLGIVKISVPADDYEQPVAVGINDPILWDHRHPASVIDVAPFEGSLYYSDAQSSIELLARTKLNLSGGNLTGAVSSDVGAATANELPTYRQVKDWVEQEIEPLATYEYVDGQLNERLEDRPTFTQMDEAIQSEVIVRPTFDQLDVILEDYYTELQADELLATKVDKVVGKELSTNDLTDPLFNKLVSLESSHYRGLFTSLAKLIAGVANPVSGDYADVDTAGSPILRYIWDVTDSVWEPQQGDTPPLTPEQVKQLYEANDNTNAFTDGLLGKLQNIQALATKNQTDAFLLDRTNHTGHQAIGTIANLQQTLDALEVEVDKSVRSVDGRIGDVVLTDLYTPLIKHNINATTPPTATDGEEEGYSILSVWITNDGGIWICTSATIPAIWNSVAAVDLGSAAYLNIGTSPQNIPTNEILTSELGQAAWLDVGTNNDQVPTMLNVKTITENLDFIKVDKVEGMGLSANDFTIQLKEKLEALEGTHFRGTFISPTQLVQYAIDPVAGDYANVDGGFGSQVVQYIYDADDLLWVPQQATVPPITASQVKQLYESNPNTNVYDNTAKAVVDGVTAKFDKADIAQATGTATDKVMSQKAVTDALGNKVDKELGYSLLSDTEIARLVTMETAATKNRADIENADKVHTHTTAQVTGLDAALTGKASTTDPRFTDAREWTATTLPQAEAEAGVATTRRAFTAQRVRQAIVAWFNGISGALGRTILTRTTAAQVRADIGLGAVDNTSDTDKPVSTAVADGLSLKVDKVTGKGLSDTNFTQAEKDKLSSLENSKFVGLFVSDSALPATGSDGDYANIDGGVGSDVYRVLWDSSDNKWVRVQGAATELTPAQIKQQYEGNPDTNAFTDDEKAKLASVANNATANRSDSANADKVHTHTTAQVTGLDTALAGKADKTTQVIAGTGLSGGGDLTANRTLSVTYGTAVGTAAQGNDSRINNGQTAFGWGSHASAGYAKTKADVGLSGIPNTNASTANFLRGDGTWVTPPNTNTTYAEITDAEIDAGTASTLRTISGRRMKYALDKKSDTGHGHALSDVADLQGAIDSKANTSTQVIAGTGLSGGGSLETNRTLTVNYGTAAGTAAQGNDSRIDNGQTAFGWGNHATAGYVKTDTKYTAGNGLTLSGTVFSLPITVTGSGTHISDVVQTATGITVTKATPPNTDTTYAEIPSAEVTTGTASTLRTITGRRLKEAVVAHGLAIGATATTAKAGNWAPSWDEVASKPAFIGAGTTEAEARAAIGAGTSNLALGTAAGTAAQGNDSRIVNAVPNSRTITAGTGLTGGGDLTANRTLTVSYGTTAGTAAQGNDSRITGALQSSQVAQVAGTSTTNVMSQAATTSALSGKVDKVEGKCLSDTNYTQVEKTKLEGIASAATKNRSDTLNADKVHTHVISDVTGLQTALDSKVGTDAIANIPSVPKSSAYTATASDKGKSIDTTAGVTFSASVFTVGDVIVVTNTGASDISITPATDVTFRLAGTDSTGLRTLAGYGVATFRMVSFNVWFASGAGLS